MESQTCSVLHRRLKRHRHAALTAAASSSVDVLPSGMAVFRLDFPLLRALRGGISSSSGVQGIGVGKLGFVAGWKRKTL